MSKFNKWFLAQEKGRQDVLKEDRWMMAAAAFVAGEEGAKKRIEELEQQLKFAEEQIDYLRPKAGE